MEFTAAQIAHLIQGTIEGNADALITSFGKIEEAQSTQLTFFSNPRFEEHLYTSKASVIIINAQYHLKQPLSATLIRVPDAYKAFVVLLGKYQELRQQQLQGIQQPAYISATARLGNAVYIGAFAYVGEEVTIGNNTKIYPNVYLGDGVKIGDNCVLHPGVKIYAGCVLSNQVILHAGTVIGADGFGYIPGADGVLSKVPQIGNVVIEEGVEVGANTTIDRATMGSTIIRSGAKLDNLVQVAHNVEIGNHTVIAAQAGISGSTKIGNRVMIGGQAGFAHHIQVADDVKIGGQAGVTRTIKTPNTSVNDTPAFNYAKTLRSQALYRQLPDLEKRVQRLERNQEGPADDKS